MYIFINDNNNNNNNNNDDDDNNNKLMMDFVLKLKRLNNKNIYLAIFFLN